MQIQKYKDRSQGNTNTNYKEMQKQKYRKIPNYIDKVRSVAAEWAGDNSCKYKEHTRECKYKTYKEIQIQMFRKYKYRNTRNYRKIQTNILTTSDQ